MLVRTNRSVSLALRGPQSLGTLLASRGYPSVPSESDPAPNGAPYFNGGFNTVTHGSIVAGTTSAIQIEANYTGVRDSAANRRRFAEAILGALRGYFSYWFDLTI
jgi:hypothetical protein